MADRLQVSVMRSQLGRVRGLGAAKIGSHHWWAQRWTALSLLPLTLWFVYSVLSLAGQPHAAMLVWARQPVHTVLLLCLVGATFHHMQLGLQVVVEDYIHGEPTKLFSLLGIKAVTILLALACAVSVLKLAF